MTNIRLPISEYVDLEIHNLYAERLEKGYPEEAVMESIYARGRDNARTPMQWEDSPNAGFTTGTPWLPVNPNYHEINAAAALADPDSVFYHYQKLIRLRKTLPQTRGTEICWHDIPESPRLVCYDRPGREETVRVFLNAGKKPVRLDNCGPVFFSRHYTDGELAPGGVLIFTYRNV